MVAYDFSVVKTAITEVEKDRIIAIYFNTDNAGVTDWEKATKDYGAASIDSMKVSIRNTYKKIEKAGGKLAEDGTPTQAPTTPAPATPATGKKRKSKSEIAAANGEEADATFETPKSKRGRPKKAVTPKVVDDAMEGDDGQFVKPEANDELA